MGIVVCTLNTEQDEVLCCPLCCCRLCCSRCRHCCSCSRCCYRCCCSRCCYLCSCCPCCRRCPCCCYLCSCCPSCCCYRPCCPPGWLQCPPPGPPCSPGLCPEARFHPHHQPCDQPRPSCRSCPRPWSCCCLIIYRRAGLKQDNKPNILNLINQT